MAKETYYFSHDSNALTDTKILNMRADYGLEGYGLYWVIIEMLRNEESYKLSLNKNTYRAIKTLTNTTIDIEKFIKDCIEDYELFLQEDEKFYSNSLLKRMLEYERKKEANKKNGMLGGRPKKTEKKPNGFENETQGYENETQKNQSKGKENKEKENKENKNNNIPVSEAKTSSTSAKASKHKYGEYKNVLLKDKELQSLQEEYQNWKELITYLDEYIEMKGYKAKSHYLCIKKWVVEAVKRQNVVKQAEKNKTEPQIEYEEVEYENEEDYKKRILEKG